MHIRPVQNQDIETITHLARSLLDLHRDFDGEYYRIGPDFENHFQTWAASAIHSNSQFIFVAETDKPEHKIAGFIAGYIKSLFPWFHHKAVGHITFLAVDPDFRRKSVGRNLEKNAVFWFRQKNVSYIEVYTDEVNIVGGLVWHSYGYLPFKKFLRKKI